MRTAAVHAAVVVIGVVVGAYFLIDSTPVDWMIRLAIAGAVTAGVAFVLYALAAIATSRRAPP